MLWPSHWTSSGIISVLLTSAARFELGRDLSPSRRPTLTPEGRLRSGPSLREAVEAVDEATDGQAAWFGTNCSHPLEFEDALADAGPWLDRLRYIRPNAARMDKIALCSLGHLEDGDPVELGEQMGAVARLLAHTDIIGGCCGTDERHLLEIARNVNAIRNH